MYGFIIEGIRQAVLVTHGADVWKKLCTRLSAMNGGKSLAADESFQAASIYGEGMPIEIARAATEVLGCSLDALLEACGEFYITVRPPLPTRLQSTRHTLQVVWVEPLCARMNYTCVGSSITVHEYTTILLFLRFHSVLYRIAATTRC